MARNNRKLIREAIADAKQMRETAVATARVALEEAFAPQFSALIAQRLREQDDEFDMEDEFEDEIEELNDPVTGDAHGSEDGGETDIEGVEKSSFTEDVDDTVSSDSDLESSGVGDIAPDHGMKTAPGPKEPKGGSGGQSSDIDDEGKLGMNEDFDELDIDDEEEDELGLEQDEFDFEDEEEDDLDLESVIAELEADLEDDEFEDDELAFEQEDDMDITLEPGEEDEVDIDLGEDDDLEIDIEDDEDDFELGENWPEDPAGSASDGHGSDEGGENDADAITRSSFTEAFDEFEDDEEEFDLEEILREIEDEVRAERTPGRNFIPEK